MRNVHIRTPEQPVAATGGRLPLRHGGGAGRPGLASLWFAAPALVIYLFVVIWPSLQGAGLSLTDWDGLSPQKEFVGLDNFAAIFRTPDAAAVIWHTVFIAAACTVIQNSLGLLLALGVHSRIKSRNALRVALFAPVVVTPVATAYLFKYLLAPTGPVNAALEAVGLGSLVPSWLGDPDVVLWSIVGVVVWQYTGYSMVIFLAGLQGVPSEVIEASCVDGAGPFRRFWHVVRPELAPAITINVMLTVIGGLKIFDVVWVMTRGGPGTSSDTMSTMIYRTAFSFGEFGSAAAMAVLLTVFVALVSSVQYYALSRSGGAR